MNTWSKYLLMVLVMMMSLDWNRALAQDSSGSESLMEGLSDERIPVTQPTQSIAAQARTSKKKQKELTPQSSVLRERLKTVLAQTTSISSQLKSAPPAKQRALLVPGGMIDTRVQDVRRGIAAAMAENLRLRELTAQYEDVTRNEDLANLTDQLEAADRVLKDWDIVQSREQADLLADHLGAALNSTQHFMLYDLGVA